MGYSIFAALHEETSNPYVWVSCPTYQSRSIITIINTANNKKIYCEYRKLDENYMKHYNKQAGTCEIKDGSNTIVMSGWYRELWVLTELQKIRGKK